MKKALSVFLAVLMLFLVAVPGFAVDNTGTDVPNVYVQGQGEPILNTKGEDVFIAKFDETDYLVSAIADCIPSFMSAILSDTDEAWDAYNAQLRGWLDEGFGDYFLGKDGVVTDGTYPKGVWDGQPLKDTKTGGKYALATYKFVKDWRLDPCDNAALLSDYIDAVKAATGYDKVNLIGRCEGANIVMAYLAEYGYKDDLNSVVLYVSSANGVDTVSALFSGNIYFDTASLLRYKDQMLTLGDTDTAELIDSLIEFATNTRLLDVASITLTALIKKVYTKVISGAIRDTYGTLPGIWSLVRADEYEDAKAGIFGGYEEEYAALIEKLDHYDVTVRQRTDEIIKEAVARGVKIANFSKYGEYQVPPLTKTNNEYSDGSVSVKLASMGAYSPRYGNTLSDIYLKLAERDGSIKYISPDKVVDASTCLLPDTTWFIYNSGHQEFPATIDAYMLEFLKADGELTVFDNPEMPQFLTCSSAEEGYKVSVMTEENGMHPEGLKYLTTKAGWRDMIMRFINAIVTFFKQLVSSIFNKGE